MKDTSCLDNLRECPTSKQIEVTLPNGDTIKSTHIGELKIGPCTARQAHVFLSLWGSLLSIGTFVDQGCTVAFDKKTVRVYDSDHQDKTVILHGTRSPQTHNLWMIDLNTSNDNKQHHAASMIPACDTSAQRVQWVHRTFGSPVPSTFINAWDKGWIRVPGITSRIVKKHQHILHSTQSAEGHLDQARQGAHSSTKSYASRQARKGGDTTQEEFHPTHIFTEVVETNHLDATGRFPVTSSLGKNYVLIMYSETGNYIKAIAMKDRLAPSYLAAHREGLTFFESRGLKPTFQRMDNETSGVLAQHLRKHNITVDFVPVGQHRRNIAERAIRTFKNHFIAILAGVDPNFPGNLWCSLLQQAELTINILRESTCHPRMSAWEEINGALDFNRTPIAPPGMRVTVHSKPDRRHTWEKHGAAGYYTGPALDHYRCYTVVMQKTGATRITDTLAWHPHGCSMPAATPLELLTDATATLSHALHALSESNIISATTKQPLHELMERMDTNLHDLVHLFTPTAEAMDASNLRVPSTTEPIQRVPSTTASSQRVSPNTPLDKSVAYHPSNGTAVPPGFSPLSNLENIDKNIEDTLNTSSIAEDTSVTSSVEFAQHQKIHRKKSATAQNNTVRDKQHTKNCKVPTVSTRPRRTTRRAARYINEILHPVPAAALNNMIRTRFAGNPRGARERRPAPTSMQYIAQCVRRMRNTLKEDWSSWTACSGVELDSTGIPSFTASTAVDLNDVGKKLTFPVAMKGKDAAIWLHEHGVEISKLIDTLTTRPIHWTDLPADKKPTYYSPQVRTKIKNGALVYRVRGTIGGNRIDYAGDKQAFTAAMQTIKILLNSAISDPDAKIMTADIKDFYLGTPMTNREYMRVELRQIPMEVQLKYNLQSYANQHGVILMEIMKGIYGLPQAGKLAQDRLVAHLASHGYHQAKNTPCLFTHETRNLAFTLVVDDFCIKYTKEEDAQHLLTSLRELYVMTEDWAAVQKYVGITITHDRANRTMTLSMPGYVDKALLRFNVSDIRGADSPIIYVPPVRGQKIQYAPDEDEDDPPLSAADVTRVQEIVGVFLFYARAVDPTMLTALSKISSQQAVPTQRTMAAVNRFLQYAKQMPSNEIVYRPSDMQMQAQSDASYLSESSARSRAGMILYFGLNEDGSVNGLFDAASGIIPTVCSSVAEAEYAALFLAGKEITSARHTLIDLGHPQDSTIIRCDNSCAVGVANNTMKQKRSKAIDMRYHWIRDQVRQKKVTVTWEAGASNLADFFTKAHPVHHHKAMRPIFVHTPKRNIIVETSRSRRIARMELKKTTKVIHKTP